MKHKVKISAYCFGVSSLSIVILLVVAVCAILRGNPLWFFLCAMVCIFCLAALFYAPMSISADNSNLSIHRSLRIKDIPLSDIAEIRLCQPTMAARRICGSGGFLGYWGWFSERDLGRYFAYYGKASDCFLVTLRNGKRYMLGCTSPAEMVDFVTRNLSSQN